MKTDQKIQQDVLDQLKWNPLLKASEIGVAVKNGIVTLSGQVNTYQKKVEAEKEAKKVAGVKAIAEEIQVGISPLFKKTDPDIAEAIINALKWNTSIPEETLKVKVEEGIVTLEGDVEWAFQRKSAEEAVVNLAGVRSVINNIKIKQKVMPDDVKQKISAAFHRHASIDADKIQVEILGTKLTLKGKVRSFAEVEDAERAAWSAPGILTVVNNLEVIEMEQEPELSF
jgi:osmotically-inducible protein OsmY